MKLNWGIGITIFIIAFMGFILFMVVKAFNTNTDLQAEDYYQQELDFQQKIDAIRLGKPFVHAIEISQAKDFVSLAYSDTLANNLTEGKISFYRPNNAGFDKEFEIDVSNNQIQEIPKSALVRGGYILKLEWKMGEELHYLEQKIIIN